MIDADLNRDVIARVREAADLVDVAGEHVRLKKKGRTWEGLCPFHEEKTPSFSIDAEKGLYYCFGCHQGGDVFKFVMQLENLDFPEAVERLAHRYGVTLPPRSPHLQHLVNDICDHIRQGEAQMLGTSGTVTTLSRAA